MVSGHSLLELAAVMARCALFIGEPSGPTHLARAVGTPTLSLQGPGDRRYPGQDRLGAVWWPQDPPIRGCPRSSGASGPAATPAGCRFTEPDHRFKHALKRVGVWDTWKGVRKKSGRAAPALDGAPAHFPASRRSRREEAAAAASRCSSARRRRGARSGGRAGALNAAGGGAAPSEGGGAGGAASS